MNKGRKKFNLMSVLFIILLYYVIFKYMISLEIKSDLES